MAEVPVLCASCRESYIVEPEDIGEIVECECGSEIEVPDVVLRGPMKADPSFALKPLPSSQIATAIDMESMHPNDLVSTPVLTTEADPSELSDASERLTVDSARLQSSDETDDERDGTDKKASGRRKNLLPIVGFGSVVALLLISIGAFATSRLADEESPGQSKATQTASNTKPSRPFSEQKINRRLLAKLLNQVPDPKANTKDVLSQAGSLGAEPSTTAQAGSNEGKAADNKRSPYGGPVAKRNWQLPKAAKASERIPEVPVDRPRMQLASAYKDMFESYEALGAMDEKEKKNLSDSYRKALGETLFLCRHAFQIAQKEKDQTKVNELSYFLAYLSYSANQFIEASIYGEMAARWGDPKEASTREAATIAIAACQEANQSHWGTADQLGELEQLKTVAELLQKRWPDNDNLDAVWMFLAQSYFAFGDPKLAAENFLKIPEKSDQFAAAQLAAGNAYWSYFVDQANTDSPNSKKLVALLKKSAKHLRVAVESMQKVKKAAPTMNLMLAKILLSRISGRLGDQEAALKWLIDEPMAVTKTITTDSSKQKGKVLVDNNVADSVFEKIYRIEVAQGNWKQAYQSLASLDDQSPVELGARFTALTSGFIKHLKQAKKVDQAQVDFLEKLVDSVKTHDPNRFAELQVWLGQSWVSLGRKTVSDELAKACFANAENAFAIALKQPDFPASSRLSVALTRADLLERSGNPSASLESIAKVLQGTPNAISLQMRAAKLLQEIAFQQDKVGGLIDAINGPSGKTTDGEASAVWGWVKLTNTLHQLSFSDKGTEEYKRMAREAGFYLARCQWLLAKVTEDPEGQKNQLSKLKSQITRRLALSGVSDGQGDVWHSGLEALLKKIE